MANPVTDELRLFAFGSGWGIPLETAAPFPLKRATWLRTADIPYEIVITNDPSKGPSQVTGVGLT